MKDEFLRLLLVWLYGFPGGGFLAKIAMELDQALARRKLSGSQGRITSKQLAGGTGWSVSDVLCTSGPGDRSFGECHSGFSIALVVQGSFQYRTESHCGSSRNRELMTPGSFLLGNAGESFECGHEHGIGDRCLSFHYSHEMFEGLASELGSRGRGSNFRVPKLPPLRALSPLVAKSLSCLAGSRGLSWEELSVQMAVQTIELAGEFSFPETPVLPSTEARITRVIRLIERAPDEEYTLLRLATEANLSLYHFLRVFEQIAGLTPHQYLLRIRLRNAAMRLVEQPAKILDIAFDSGFSDVSNFNRAFRAEFGMSPRKYRQSGNEMTF